MMAQAQTSEPAKLLWSARRRTVQHNMGELTGRAALATPTAGNNARMHNCNNNNTHNRPNKKQTAHNHALKVDKAKHNQ